MAGPCAAADVRTNSLVVIGQADEIAIVEVIVRQLDETTSRPRKAAPATEVLPRPNAAAGSNDVRRDQKAPVAHRNGAQTEIDEDEMIVRSAEGSPAVKHALQALRDSAAASVSMTSDAQAERDMLRQVVRRQEQQIQELHSNLEQVMQQLSRLQSEKSQMEAMLRQQKLEAASR